MLCPALRVSAVPPRKGESAGDRNERRTPGHKPGPSCPQPEQEGRAGFSPALRGNTEIWPLLARRSGPRARRCCRWLHSGWMSRTRPLASRDQIPGALCDPDPQPRRPLPGHLLHAGAANQRRVVIDVAADHRAAHVQPQHKACGRRARRALLRAPLLLDRAHPQHPDPASLYATTACGESAFGEARTSGAERAPRGRTPRPSPPRDPGSAPPLPRGPPQRRDVTAAQKPF